MKTIKNLFVPFKLAQQLKEKGFNEMCFGWWMNKSKISMAQVESQPTEKEFCSAPLYQQAIDWLREEKNLYVVAHPSGGKWKISIRVLIKDDRSAILKDNPEHYTNYCEALNAAIDEASKLIP